MGAWPPARTPPAFLRFFEQRAQALSPLIKGRSASPSSSVLEKGREFLEHFCNISGVESNPLRQG